MSDPVGPRHTRRGPSAGGGLHGRSGGWPALIAVLVVLLGVGIVVAVVPTSIPTTPVLPSTLAAPVDSQSSSWYCTGGTGSASHGSWQLMVTNPTGATVTGTATLVTAGGAKGPRHLVPVSVPVHGTQAIDATSIASGSWMGAAVVLNAGGATVSSALQNGAGWSMTPCSTSVATNWYFAAGSTTSGTTLETLVYNPTATPAVVNLSFATGSGLAQPSPFQGLVLPPGRMVVESVGTLVQDQSSVATMVTSESGRVVAGEVLLARSSETSGAVLLSGSTGTRDGWIIPSTVDTPGGTTTLSVLNPSGGPAEVTVHVQLSSGPVSPLRSVVAAGTAWQLVLSSQTRIPASEPYTVSVTATGGGVVVARTVQAPSSGSTSTRHPRLGALTALGDPTGLSEEDATSWLVSPPGPSTSPVVTNARTSTISIMNPGSTATVAAVFALGASGREPVSGHLKVPAGRFVDFTPSATAPEAYVVTASRDVVVTSDLLPSAATGVVSAPGIPSRH